LASIADASRVALDDLRRMLGVLQDDTGGQPSLSPIPRLAELNLLATAHRATHGPLELTVDPRLHGLSDSVQLTTFRLVQEALTNVGKYAPGAAARVDLRTERGSVYVDVENEQPLADEPLAARSSGGFGLAGMRERAALFGGTVDAGPRPTGGFRVVATLRASSEEGLVV
jgi:signal transduction histidine kinase